MGGPEVGQVPLALTTGQIDAPDQPNPARCLSLGLTLQHFDMSAANPKVDLDTALARVDIHHDTVLV